MEGGEGIGENLVVIHRVGFGGCLDLGTVGIGALGGRMAVVCAVVTVLVADIVVVGGRIAGQCLYGRGI